MSKRSVRPEELELWNKVARTTERLSPTPKPAEPTFFDPKPTKEPKPAKPATPIEPFELGSRTTDTHSRTTASPPRAHVAMDKNAYGKLKRGKLKPEGRIDLHGMTQEKAHGALNAFIMSAFAQEKRLVLVITGKGKQVEDYGPIPVRPGVLRRNVPHWLQSPPLSQVVIQVVQAHGRHGGDGAYYVYLKRRR